jgi:hypothetical protein
LRAAALWPRSSSRNLQCTPAAYKHNAALNMQPLVCNH